MEKSAIEQIQASQVVQKVADQLAAANLGVPHIAVHKDVELKNVEAHLPGPTRIRGRLETAIIADYCEYCIDRQELQGDQAQLFFDDGELKAKAFFNLGNEAKPGHGDDTAVLSLRKTGDYRKLLTLDDCHFSQTQFAEFLEEWRESLALYPDFPAWQAKDVTPNPAAVADVRKVTVQERRESTSSEQQRLSARSSMEELEVTGKDIPGIIDFTCEPYYGLAVRTFTVRVSMVIRRDEVTFVTRLIQHEKHVDEMRVELMGKVGEELGGLIGDGDMPLFKLATGDFTPSGRR